MPESSTLPTNTKMPSSLCTASTKTKELPTACSIACRALSFLSSGTDISILTRSKMTPKTCQSRPYPPSGQTFFGCGSTPSVSHTAADTPCAAVAMLATTTLGKSSMNWLMKASLYRTASGSAFAAEDDSMSSKALRTLSETGCNLSNACCTIHAKNPEPRCAKFAAARQPNIIRRSQSISAPSSDTHERQCDATVLMCHSYCL